LSQGASEIWKIWLNFARPTIYSSKAERYKPDHYNLQRSAEYARRATDWGALLRSILAAGAVPADGKVLDVGANLGAEVTVLPQTVVCADPAVESLLEGRRLFPQIHYVAAVADALPFRTLYFDAYLSFRTWCISGVLADEALEAALNVVRPGGLMVVSFPLQFDPKSPLSSRTLDSARDDKVKEVALWAASLLETSLEGMSISAAPEDLIMTGRTPKIPLGYRPHPCKNMS
jgi:SAM-dependent methyltransferase